TDVPLGRADPWLVVLPGRRGTIYPWGGDRLAVEVDGRPQLARPVGAPPRGGLGQDGGAGEAVTLPAELVEPGAPLVQPRRRRKLTQEQRARLAEVGAGFRFRHGAQSSFSERQAFAEARDDPGAT